MMKKTNSSTKKAFTIAELLISMLVVCVVAAALVPMIGPKKTKSMRQKMVHGYYVCYWNSDDPQNKASLTLQQAAYSRNPKNAGSGAVVGDHCEFSPPKANFYNILVIAASGDGATDASLQSQVGWKDSENNIKGPLYKDSIPLDPDYNYAINHLGPIMGGLIDKILQNNGPLAAQYTLTSGSQGPGNMATQTDDSQWDESGMAAVYSQGNPNAPGGSGGQRKMLNVYAWLNKSTSIGYGSAAGNTDSVSLSVNGNGMDAYFELSAAGRGSDAFDLFSGSSNGQNGWSFDYAGSTYTMPNGTRLVVNSSTVNGKVKAHRVGTSPYNYTWLNVSDIMQDKGMSFSAGTPSSATVQSPSTTNSGVSGFYPCTVKSGVCKHGYNVSNYNNGQDEASIGTIQATTPVNGFPWEYRGYGIKLKATLAGEPGEYKQRLFNKLDGKLVLYPAKMNTKNGQPNGELTTSDIKFIKTGSNGEELSLISVKSGKNAPDPKTWESPVTPNSNEGYMDYKKEYGIFPETIGIQEGIIPKDVLGLPVDVPISYQPGKAGNGAYPLIDKLKYMPRAKMTTAMGTYEYDIEHEAFDLDLTSDILKYTCPDGVSSPATHPYNGKTQYYCQARKGYPGIVVVSW